MQPDEREAMTLLYQITMEVLHHLQTTVPGREVATMTDELHIVSGPIDL